ncbi:hypothetical protein BaRGS_00032039 [Batillaria attramentaria]|uniref:Uncharacterized protein n=1 Tax=Batillaria attramentaria TaxID=370345 RepID=A0ABD0JPU2_9CAEN
MARSSPGCPAATPRTSPAGPACAADRTSVVCPRTAKCRQSLDRVYEAWVLESDQNTWGGISAWTVNRVRTRVDHALCTDLQIRTSWSDAASDDVCTCTVVLSEVLPIP